MPLVNLVYTTYIVFVIMYSQYICRQWYPLPTKQRFGEYLYMHVYFNTSACSYRIMPIWLSSLLHHPIYSLNAFVHFLHHSLHFLYLYYNCYCHHIVRVQLINTLYLLPQVFQWGAAIDVTFYERLLGIQEFVQKQTNFPFLRSWHKNILSHPVFNHKNGWMQCLKTTYLYLIAVLVFALCTLYTLHSFMTTILIQYKHSWICLTFLSPTFSPSSEPPSSSLLMCIFYMYVNDHHM